MSARQSTSSQDVVPLIETIATGLPSPTHHSIPSYSSTTRRNLERFKILIRRLNLIETGNTQLDNSNHRILLSSLPPAYGARRAIWIAILNRIFRSDESGYYLDIAKRVRMQFNFCFLVFLVHLGF